MAGLVPAVLSLHRTFESGARWRAIRGEWLYWPRYCARNTTSSSPELVVTVMPDACATRAA